MQGPGAYRVRAGDFGGQPDRVSVPCLVKVVLRSGDTGGLCPVGLALAAGDDVPGLAEPAHLESAKEAPSFTAGRNGVTWQVPRLALVRSATGSLRSSSGGCLRQRPPRGRAGRRGCGASVALP